MFSNFPEFRLVSVLALIAFAACIWFPEIVVPINNNGYLTVKFLDVGQGDAIHVMTPDGYEMLIDGGSSSQVLREFSKDRYFFDKQIDIVMATHPDTDHVGGLVDVLERYEVDTIIKTNTEHSSPASVAFAGAENKEGAQTIIAQAGQVIRLGASTTIKIYSPKGDTKNWKSNNASIITQIIYGDIEFMLTGDAPSSIEDHLVGIYDESLESEVLKLGHHGSKTSTSENFIKTVKPEYAVVSAGDNNSYGHPHDDVVNRVNSVGVKVFSTAESGTIVFKSDGKEVWVE